MEKDQTNLLACTKNENGRLIEESQERRVKEVDEEQNGEALGDATGNDDEAIRTYIQHHIKKFGGVSTENVRKTFAIGWIRAKRLHDQEMGLKTDEVRYASDEKLRGYIRRCFEEKGSCSVNHLRQEFSVGYNRAKKILDEEKERVEYGEREPEGALLLGLSGEDDLGRKGRGKNRATHKSPRPADATFDDARMQGLEEDVSYLLGMGMGVHVTQRERKRGRTEDESICETALNTLLAINGSESPDTTKPSSGPDRAARSAAKWTMLENAREELQRKLEEAKEKRKLLRGRAKDSASESRRRRASKSMETALGASMGKVKAKLAEIESLREQLDREVRRSKEERQGAAAGLPYTPTTERTETEGERMLTRKRRREANNGRGIESNIGLAERLHKLLETIANLARELSEQHDAIRALPRCGSSAASPPLPDLAPTALTSSLLSACLLSLTTHSLRSDVNEGELTPSSGTSASTSPILLRRSLSPAQSPVPVTFTYPVPTLSSQEFIKSLEALTCSSSSGLLSPSPSPSFSSSLGGSLSFTIPCAPPPSLASSLSFTSLPPPLPTFTDAGGDGMPSSSSSSSSATVFFPPPPLPTLPVSSAFPASFPYVDYIVGVQPGGSEAAKSATSSSTPIVPSTSPSDAIVGDDVERRTAKANGQKRRRERGTIVKHTERDGGGSQMEVKGANEEDEWRVEMQVGDGSDEEKGGDNDENRNTDTDTNGSSIGDQEESEEAPVKRKRGKPRRSQEKKTRR